MGSNKLKKWLWLAIPLVGLIIGFILMTRSVTIVVDGSQQMITTHALTVRGALRDAGIRIHENDSVDPAAGTFLSGVKTIQVNHAGMLFVWITPQDKLIPVQSSSRIPSEILRAAGIEIKPTDSLMVNGSEVDPARALQAQGRVVLQYTPAMEIKVTRGLKTDVLTSSASWLGQALWDNGITLKGANQLSAPFTQALTGPQEVSVDPAVAVEIDVDGRGIQTLVPMGTTGQALASAGISLQDLDYSIPADSDPLPVDGRIKVVRVREEVSTETSLIPFKTDYVMDANVDLDSTKVTRLGQPGVQVVKVITRFEDGKQVSQVRQDAVVLQQPVDQQEAYGTKITVKTMNTPDGPISYYRAVTVRVTSYSPCRSGGDRCYYGTSSGLPVQKGVIGVTRDWYHLFAMDQIYVPGYGIGTIADVGGGIPGSYWVDLGYSDSDWVNWWGTVTIYFLTPVPANVPGVLP